MRAIHSITFVLPSSASHAFQPEFSAFPPTILFINSLTPVLISRFLINLRNVESTITSSGGGGGGEGDHGQGFSVTGVSTMRFDAEGDGAQSRVDRIIGPMGEDLEDGSAFTSTDDEEESSGSSAYRTEEDGEKLHHEVPTVGVDDSAEKDGHAGIDIQEVCLCVPAISRSHRSSSIIGRVLNCAGLPQW